LHIEKIKEGYMKPLKIFTFATFLIVAIGAIAFGQESAPSANSGDTAWMLTSATLVLLMTIPGLALFYGGMVRGKNVISTIYYSVAAAFTVSITWVIYQYSLIFSGDIGGIIGNLDKLFLKGVTIDSVSGTIPEYVFVVFQMVFGIITVALISGSIVERMNFGAWIIFILLWSLLVYTPLAHMVWGGGYIGGTLGALDFAGGLVVHTSSGITALILAIVLGERIRYGKENILPHNIVYTFIGAALLWIGWFGFNAGSGLASNGLAGNAWLVTNTAAAAAGISWMLIDYIMSRKVSLIGAATGVIAGLVAITPASGFVNVGGAIFIGFTVSILSYIFVSRVKKALKYDDSLDVFGVHAIGGMWGALMTGVFADPSIGGKAGLLYGNPNQFLAQVISILITILLVVVGTLISLFITSLITKLRVEPQEEVYGLDFSLHGEKAYEK
jgi:Amt family ammonium transporter